MRKRMLMLILLLLAIAGFAQEKMEIVLLGPDINRFANAKGYTGQVIGETQSEKIRVLFERAHPNVKLKYLLIDFSTGATLSMDALIAAGTPPDVYDDYLGKSSKYMVPEYALDLKKYLPDLDDYRPGALDPLTRNGKLLGLPKPGNYQAMCLNLTLLKKAGYVVPNNWTTDDFLVMAEKVKALNSKAWATGMFAENQSGDYLSMNWMSSFGGRLYKSGDYSKTTLDTPAGLETFRWWKMLLDKGYIQKESAVLDDDDYAAMWSQGQYAATAFFPGWISIYFKNAKGQGLIKEAHEVGWAPFPRAKGITQVPVAGSMPGIVVHASKDEARNKLVADLVLLMNGPDAQDLIIRTTSVYSNRKSVKTAPDDPDWRAIDKIVNDNGILDLGLASPKFSPVRALGFPILQGLFTGKLTPEKALAQYVADVNRTLAE